MKKYVKADRFYLGDEVKENGYLEIDGQLFGTWSADLPEHGAVLDYSGYQIAPGLVDTHIHGFAGQDVMDNSAEALKIMSQELLSAGITSFLPTTLTAPSEALRQVCQTIAATIDQTNGAKMRGIYLEGPYFTEEFKGAQNTNYMGDPDLAEFEGWQTAAQGWIKKIALAPERKTAPDFIMEVTQQGITVALGHSNATYQEALAAVQAGADVWVHAYNGMRGLTHREPGMVGGVFHIPHTYAELICDGYHVSPVACDILLQQKDTDHVALISDCMRAGGCPDGVYLLGELPVIVADHQARLKDSGNLAGSVLKLSEAIQNLVNWNIASPAEAIKMATLIPAISSKIDDVCGKIAPGYEADFIVLDQDLNLIETFIDGQSKWKK